MAAFVIEGLWGQILVVGEEGGGGGIGKDRTSVVHLFARADRDRTTTCWT